MLRNTKFNVRLVLTAFMMDSPRIPEIPPSPLKYSINLYCLSDVLRPLQDELEFIDDTSLIPEREPEPLLYEIDLHSAENSCFIPEEPPIPLKHNIDLLPSDDLSRQFSGFFDSMPPLSNSSYTDSKFSVSVG